MSKLSHKLYRLWGPLLVTALLLIPFASQAEEPSTELILIAHSEFPLGEISLKYLDRIYLGRAKGIGDVKVVLRVHAPFESNSYKAFARKVHRMTVPELRRYWAKEVIMGRRSPPRQFDSMNTLIKFVLETPNALGYIPAEMNPAGVKVLRVQGKSKF